MQYFYKELSENMIYNYHSIVCKTLGNRPANRYLSFKRRVDNYVYQLINFLGSALFVCMLMLQIQKSQ